MAHILALYYLTRDQRAYCIIAGLELFPNGDANAIGEFDFIYIVDQKLHVGECKSGSVLADKDVRTAELAVELGCDRFYFCSLSEFDDASVEKIKTFGQRHTEMSYAILTQDQLLGGESEKVG